MGKEGAPKTYSRRDFFRISRDNIHNTVAQAAVVVGSADLIRLIVAKHSIWSTEPSNRLPEPRRSIEAANTYLEFFDAFGFATFGKLSLYKEVFEGPRRERAKMDRELYELLFRSYREEGFKIGKYNGEIIYPDQRRKVYKNKLRGDLT